MTRTGDRRQTVSAPGGSLLHLPEGRVTHERCLGENRIFGHRGLKRLEHRQRGGLIGLHQCGVLFLDKRKEGLVIFLRNPQ